MRKAPNYLDMESVGRRIRLARGKTAMINISAQIGSERSHLIRIEQGKICPSMSIFSKLVNAVDASYNYVFAHCSKACNDLVYYEMLERIKDLPPKEANILKEIVNAYLLKIKEPTSL